MGFGVKYSAFYGVVLVEVWMDQEKLFFTDKEIDSMFVGDGEEGFVLRYNGSALKFYYPNSRKYRLSEEDCIKMIEIPTERILLPRGNLYDKHHNFIGYYTDYIHAHYIGDIMKLKIKEFVAQLEEVYDEIFLLSDHLISLEDFCLSNFCYNHGFYFVDPGSYEFEKDKSNSSLLGHNQQEFSNFVVQSILGYFSARSSKKKQRFLSDYFLGADYLPDILKEDAKEDETVKKYVKRIIS